MVKKTCFAIACVIMALSFAAASFASPDAPAATLDGKTFAGESAEKGKTKMDKDTVTFAGGRFRSQACDAYGFGDAPYVATTAPDGSISWSAETASAKEGKIQWKGKVKGDKLEGTYVWIKAGQAPIEYWMKATTAPPK
ncbi:MAG: hypothetical protein M3167_14100 [Acidobacteriota bacterium]|nr:hypothetical protein [Acidobacteriota bacterium]